MNITSIKEVFGVTFAAVATLISTIFGAHLDIMKILVSAIVVDYVTGLMVAGAFKRSNKTETGAIESLASIRGLFRKSCMLLIVYMAIQLDLLINTNYIAIAIIYFFIANELISIIENAGLMGIPIHPVMVEAVEILKKNSDSQKNK